MRFMYLVIVMMLIVVFPVSAQDTVKKSQPVSIFKEFGSQVEAQSEFDRLENQVFQDAWKRAKAPSGKTKRNQGSIVGGDVVRGYVTHDLPEGFAFPKEIQRYTEPYCAMFFLKGEKWVIIASVAVEWGVKLPSPLTDRGQDQVYESKTYLITIKYFTKEQLEAITKSAFPFFFKGFKYEKADKIRTHFEAPTDGIGADKLSDDYYENKKNYPFLLEPLADIYEQVVLVQDPLIAARLQYFKADAELKKQREVEKGRREKP